MERCTLHECTLSHQQLNAHTLAASAAAETKNKQANNKIYTQNMRHSTLNNVVYVCVLAISDMRVLVVLVLIVLLAFGDKAARTTV